MDKTSTHYSLTSMSHSSAVKKSEQLSPSAKSLAFIRQFARCYHTESRLKPALAGMMLN